MLQLIASFRGTDSGENADPSNTGYERIYVSPGVEVNLARQLNLYADLRIPVMTHVNGYQLISPALVSATMSFGF